MALGKCLLTGANGTFVKSHLIPQALSAPVFPGAYFVSAGNRVRPTRSFTSWYDPKIVTRKGEDVLADLDSYAITVLRMHKLVWSSWGEAPCLEPSLHRIFSGAKGYRRVSFENQDKIRLFFLSLLWRWAVSTLPVAAEINLSLAQQHQLRDMILASDSGDPMLFSVELVQLSTIGERQNMSPITSVKIIEDLDSNIKKTVPFYRFYFDGLVIHIGMPSEVVPKTGLVLGVATQIDVLTIPYEDSFQKINLHHLKQDINHEFPREFKRFIVP